ncbi:MAG: hydroxysqualene dehydroxylase HpnE [Betaproteobacteria bacterium]
MSTARTRPRVAVLGGGWSGLAAAVTLAQAGVAVTVFEAACILGGRARRVEVNGVALDNGLHILIGAYREALRLIALVSDSPDQALLRLPLDLHILDTFRLHAPPLPAPLHLVMALLWSEGLSLAQRLRAARFMAQLRTGRFLLERDITVAALLTQYRQGATVRRHLWESVCTSALNTPASIASAQVFLNVLRDSLNGPRDNCDILVPRIDLSALFPEAAARYVRARGGSVLEATPVSSVGLEDDGFHVHSADGEDCFSHVVCAISPWRVPAVLATIFGAAKVLEQIDRLTYEPIYSVYLQYPRSVALPQPMFGLDGGLVQWVFDREVFCGQRGLIGTVMSASGEHEALTQDSLAEKVAHELRAKFPDLPAPSWTQVIAEKRATFACVVGGERPTQRTPVPGLYLAGDYTASDYPATLESAVISGVSCANMILQSG